MEERDSGLHLGSLVIGLTLGVAATLIYATYQEKSFNRLVRKTRELSDSSGEFFSDLTENVKERAAHLSGKMKDVVDEVEDSANEVVHSAKSLGNETAD